MNNKTLIITATSFLLMGVIASSFWYKLHYPMKPLFVELVNDTDELIPSVVIEHGRPGIQEKITVVQFKAKEKRLIALRKL